MSSLSQKAVNPFASVALTGMHLANSAIPALPGAQKSSTGRAEFRLSAQTRACSRPPDPITRTFMFFESNAIKRKPGFEGKILLC